MQATATKKMQENPNPIAKPHVRPIDLIFEDRKSAASALANISNIKLSALQGTAILPKD